MTIGGSAEQPTVVDGSVLVGGSRRPKSAALVAAELEKLTAQVRVRLAVAVVVLGPFAGLLALKLSTQTPSDTLFGRWVHDSGFAGPLLILGFAGSWVFPLLTSVVAGDIFAVEDHHGTWGLLLTRSAGRGQVFCAKTAAALLYSLIVTVLLAAGSVTAGLLLIGHQPLVGLTGNLLPAGPALPAVLGAWASVLPAVLAYAAVGIAVSVSTRSSLAGVIVPVLLGVTVQLLLLVSGPVDAARLWLPGSSFVAWPGLLADPVFRRPALVDAAASLGYTAIFLVLAWLLFRRRDVGD